MIRTAITSTLFTISAFFAAPAQAISTERVRVHSIEMRLAGAADARCIELGRSAGCGGRVMLSDSRVRNAWSYGHSIVVTKGMVQFASDDELAFVIAHEMSHNISGNEIGRDEELLADEMGVHLIAESGFDVSSSINILKRTNRFILFGSTHPSNRSRISQLTEILNRGLKVRNGPFRTIFTNIHVMNSMRYGALKKFNTSLNIPINDNYHLDDILAVSAGADFALRDQRPVAGLTDSQKADEGVFGDSAMLGAARRWDAADRVDASKATRTLISAAVQNELAPPAIYVLTHKQLN